MITNRDFVLRGLPTNSVGAEIGVYRGKFSAQILAIVRPRELHLIDPWRFEPDPKYANALYGERIGKDQANMDAVLESCKTRVLAGIASGVVKIHRAESAAAAELFADSYFDWVYIDGNHQYEFVKADLETYYPLVKPGGLIVGDDYAMPGWWGDGVERAVNEFIRSRDVKIEYIREHQYCFRKAS